ncbi:MAG: hypothetical protein N2323_04465 [candidate division WOR-3 bacterium]|nr:hypothetical protein [candidate division WOR-3 bacterium]MCX7837195.1 hypothetical protein [candidate division WOR-3 bacterium]MDW8113961.1 hypothetical protein [candidate division WOR-3 bacterium]
MDFKNQPVIARAVELAKEFNIKIFLVGGPLRDIFLRKKVLDFDLAINGDVKKFGSLLAEKLKGKFIYHPQFLTGKIIYNSNYLDIARLRDEIYEEPGALPKVIPIDDITVDLKRRDFTINAFAYDLLEDRIIDPFSGVKDLKERKIRILHERSFIDDPTRIFRAIRFAKRFNFEIEKKTFTLLKRAIKESYLKTISYQRIFHELYLILKEKKFNEILFSLSQLRIFKKIFGKSLYRRNIKELERLKSLKTPLELIFIYLLYLLDFRELRILKKEEAKIIEELDYFRKIKRRLLRAKRYSKIYQLLSPLSLSTLKIIYALEISLRRKIKIYEKIKEKRTLINGRELRKLLQKGVIKNLKEKDFSKILLHLKLKKIDGELKSKEEEIKEIIKWTQER